jgi:hypothetical protein
VNTPGTLTLALAATLLLASCGGGSREAAQRVPFATGPIQTACLQADRPRADRALCGCVQAVADDMLTRRERGRAAGFFRDPHQAQVVRQSDRPADRRLWPRYRAFFERAEQVCRAA